MAGIPVVDVTFNGSQTFEMLLDTGASRTMITRPMANVLQPNPTGSIRVSTASAVDVEFATGAVASVQVGGAIANNVDVIIGGPEQDIGLLGQNFFADYDLIIRRNVIEFHLTES